MGMAAKDDAAIVKNVLFKMSSLQTFNLSIKIK